MNLKTIFTSFLITNILLFFSFSANAETENKSLKVGFHYSPYINTNLSEFGKSGVNNLLLNGNSSFGVNLIGEITSSVFWESGLDYSLFNVQQINSQTTPTLLNDTVLTSFSLLQLPILVRFEFSDILFLSGGAFLNFQASNNSPFPVSSGIGIAGGIGLSYTFDMGLILYANPFIKFHSLIPFTNREKNANVIEGGVKIGVAYQL